MAKKSKSAMGGGTEGASDRGRFSKEISIEGVFLRVRAIIEQGRTKDFLEACRKENYRSLKGQKGIVEFTHSFIVEGHDELKGDGSTKDPDRNRFTAMVAKKTKIDGC